MFPKNMKFRVDSKSKYHAGRVGYFQQIIPGGKAVLSTKLDNVDYETFSVDIWYLG